MEDDALVDAEVSLVPFQCSLRKVVNEIPLEQDAAALAIDLGPNDIVAIPLLSILFSLVLCEVSKGAVRGVQDEMEILKFPIQTSSRTRRQLVKTLNDPHLYWPDLSPSRPEPLYACIR